jgi:hypothetical protein
MKKFLILIVSFLVISFGVANAEDKIQSITTQTNVLDYVLESPLNGIKRVSINPAGSSLIQDSKNEKEFEQFLLKNLEELPRNSNFLIVVLEDNYYKITITITNNNKKELNSTGIGINFSEALKNLEHKLDLDPESDHN